MPNQLSEQEAREQFDQLQSQLVDQWRLIGGYNDLAQTMVVIPSITIDLEIPATALQSYEERMLFLLLLLRKPRARIIYVTSRPIQEEIIDYYLGLLPGVIPSHARKRLFLVAVNDATSRPLTEKVLERPRLTQQIRELIEDPSGTHLVPFITTTLERDLALRLGIPMFGADPKYLDFGSKSGCRRLFKEEDVACPLGQEDLHSLDEIVTSIQQVRHQHPDIRRAMVKHNEGVSGMGNAEVNLENLPAPGTADEAEQIRDRVLNMKFEVEDLSCDDYLQHFAAEGGVIEERIVADNIESPSVQIRITPVGGVEMVSSHDQLLGGPSGQSFLGCRFPANPAYISAITREAIKIGERLKNEGVIGRLAVDFVVARVGEDEWKPYAIEINLRKGGTTAPLLLLEFLTQGHYDAETGEFITIDGKDKHYISTDHAESEVFRHLNVEDVFDIVVRNHLHFNQATQTGVVFHMLSAVSECGRLGLTAVEDSLEKAEALYHQTLEILEKEARMILVSS